MATKARPSSKDLPQPGDLTEVLAALPVDRLKREAMGLGKAMAHHGAVRLGEGLQGMTGRVTGAVSGMASNAPSPGDVVSAARDAGSPIAEAPGKVAGKVKETVMRDKDKGNGKGKDAQNKGAKNQDAKKEKSGKGATSETDLKVTNIVESIDVPVGREVAYDLWTQFEQFPSFMKKVETVRQRKDEEVTWRAQVFLSHRTWTAKIVDQVRPEHIVWKSEADKGRVDGAVTFHELAPDLTRVLLTLEYHPQGLFERTGNLWHAQGRRARLELKHFRRHVANHALLHQDEVDGWEGEIREGKVKSKKKVAASRTSSTSRTATASSSSRKTSSAKRPASRSTTAKKASTTPSKSTASKRTASKRTASKRTASKQAAGKKAASKSTGSRSSSQTRSTRSRG